MPPPPPHPNLLLAAISQKSRKRLLSTSCEVQLGSKTVLHEPRSRPSHAFFLTSGLASVLAVTTVGLASEVGVVGREGFSGSLHLIGPVDTPTHCRMQIAGAAVRIPFDHLQKAFQQDEDVHRRILEFVQVHTHTLSQGGRMPSHPRSVSAAHSLAADRAGSHGVFHDRHHAGGLERDPGD